MKPLKTLLCSHLLKFPYVAFYLFLVFSISIQAQTTLIPGKIDKLLFTENYAEAVSILDSLLQKDSLNIDALYKISLAYQNLYLHDKAISHLNKAGSIAPDNIKIMSALGKSYAALGIYDKAKEQYEAALLKDSANTSLLFSLARIFVEQTLYGKASEVYFKLFRKDTGNSFIMKQLGFCYLKMEDYERSTRFYELSNIFNPSDLNVALQLGVNFILLNQFEHANMLIDKYMRLYPADARFCRLKGDVLFKQKYYLQADTLYRKVISMGDSSSYVFQKSAFCNYLFAAGADSLNANQKLPYFDRAGIAFANAVESDSSNPVLFMYLALSMDKSGKFRLAIDAMERAKQLSISGIAPDICVYLGDFHRELKEYKEAIGEYNEALLLKPDNIRLLVMIGDIYMREYKDEPKALYYYEKYLKDGADLGTGFKNSIQYRAIEGVVKSIKKNLPAAKRDL